MDSIYSNPDALLLPKISNSYYCGRLRAFNRISRMRFALLLHKFFAEQCRIHMLSKQMTHRNESQLKFVSPKAWLDGRKTFVCSHTKNFCPYLEVYGWMKLRCSALFRKTAQSFLAETDHIQTEAVDWKFNHNYWKVLFICSSSERIRECAAH